MRCIHLERADEAFSIDARGRQTAVVVNLCSWPEAHPERLVDAPRWLLRMVVGGHAVMPEHDCARCPAFTAEPPT